MLQPSSAGGQPPNAQNSSAEESPDAASIRNQFGLTPEDLKKYGPPVD